MFIIIIKNNLTEKQLKFPVYKAAITFVYKNDRFLH